MNQKHKNRFRCLLAVLAPALLGIKSLDKTGADKVIAETRKPYADVPRGSYAIPNSYRGRLNRLTHTEKRAIRRAEREHKARAQIKEAA